MPRHDGRADDAMRPIDLQLNYLKNPTGSALISFGDTRVLCTASVEEKVPNFLHGSGEGWVTGEYAMIPAATDSRNQREVTRGKPSGRTMEIQRLIGRALRSVVDRKALGERTVWIDCDVLQADGGTRTAAITGGFIALCVALAKIREHGRTRVPVITSLLAAISVGIVQGRPVLDLDYVEDSSADVDMNIVRTAAGEYIEIQGTAEARPFSREHLDAMLQRADVGINQLITLQRDVLGSSLDRVLQTR